MDVDEAADELYALAPADFTARRTKLAAQARQSGGADVAKEISDLRRPTVSAGLINQLTRAEASDSPEPAAQEWADQESTGRESTGQESTGQESTGSPGGEHADRDGTGDGDDRPIERLRRLGQRLREAQANLDGAQMKELTRQRHELVAVLVRRAEELAAESGQKVSGSVQRELEETFGAALADEQASLAVTSGRLTRALVYAGFGEVDVTAATATPLGRPLRSVPTGPDPLSDRGTARSTDRTSTRSTGSNPGQHADHGPKTRQPQAGSTSAGPVGGTSGRDDADPARARDGAQARARADAEARAQKLRDEAEWARAALASAEDELATAAEHREAARARESELSGQVDQLQREILRLRHELDAASRQAVAADRDHQRQERQVRDARKASQHADQALARLDPTQPART